MDARATGEQRQGGGLRLLFGRSSRLHLRLPEERRRRLRRDVGGRVVMGKEELNAKTPVAPIDMTRDLCCPLLGLFGNDDRAPSPEQVNQHEAELKKQGKTYEFHRYDGAGH